MWLTFNGSWGPDLANRLVNMRERKFIELAKDCYNNLKAVYMSKNGWGHLPRSFNVKVLDITSFSGWESFRALSKHVERVDLF